MPQWRGGCATPRGLSHVPPVPFPCVKDGARVSIQCPTHRRRAEEHKGTKNQVALSRGWWMETRASQGRALPARFVRRPGGRREKIARPPSHPAHRRDRRWRLGARVPIGGRIASQERESRVRSEVSTIYRRGIVSSCSRMWSSAARTAATCARLHSSSVTRGESG